MRTSRTMTPFLLLFATVLGAAPCVLGQSLSDSIATVRAQQARQSRRGPDARRMEMLQKLFHTELNVDFQGTSAREVFEFMKTALDLNIIVRFHDDVTGIGIDPDTKIMLEANQTPAIDVLELVLEQCSIVDECTWQLRRSFVEVGPKERLSVSGAQELRVYPVDELLYERPRFANAPVMGLNFGYPGWVGGYDSDYSTRGRYRYPYGFGVGGWGNGGWGPGLGGQGGYSGGVHGYVTPRIPAGDDGSLNTRERVAERAEKLIDFVTSMVEPDAWQRNGGIAASIEFRDGALFVRAPEFVHRQLAGYPAIPPPQASGERDAASPKKLDTAPESREGEPDPAS